MNKQLVIHPILFSIFPILFLFVHNRGWITQYDTVIALLIATVAVSAVLLFLLTFIIKDSKKAGIIVSFFVLLFFSYGHLYEFIYVRNIDIFLFDRHRYLLLTFGFLFVLGSYFCMKTKKSLSHPTAVLNVVALALVSISLFNLVIYEFRSYSGVQGSEKDAQQNIVEQKTASESPDIYYIIFDAYSSSQTLKDFYNYDNSNFTEYLTEKGFYIAEKSLSNYDRTPQSIPSSLNMEYLNVDLIKDGDISPPDVITMIRDNKVLRFLKSKGYTIVNVGQWWEPTSYNEYADFNFEGKRYGSEFLTFVIRTTALTPFLQSYLANDTRTEILNMFSILEEVPQSITGPKFVFAHFISPHSPFVFGQNGEEVDQDDLSENVKRSRAYLNQLIFITKKIEQMVDILLTQSESPPIILIQSDHGPGGIGFVKDTDSLEKFNVQTREQLGLRAKFRNFSAYYLPSGGEKLLYKSITPVNSFRLIFNYYFDAQYELLPDRAYIIEALDKNTLPTFVDVTDEVKYE